MGDSILDMYLYETNTLLERFYEGSAKSLFAALAEKTTLSPEEAEEIRRLLFREAGK